MELYFAPLACSMATRIAFYEAGHEPRFTQVDTRTKRVSNGGDFNAINPLGQVPILRLEDGELLSENAAILQLVARRFPHAGLVGSADDLHHVQKWLSFIGTELHKGIFAALLSATTPQTIKSATRESAGSRFDVLEAHLSGGRDHMAGAFTVADAYLATVLNWCGAGGIDLGRWPAVKAYHARMLARPSIARAVSEERVLYAAEQARRAA